MKLENTTIMSAIVWVAGVLAEVIFRDELSKSMLGVILSVVLAFIVIITTYFVIDGINSVLLRERKEAEDRQRDYQDKMFKLLDEKLTEQLAEQLKFEKAIYSCVKDIKDIKNDEKDDASLQEVIQAINDNTIQAAKIIARYQTKTSHDIENVLRDIKAEFPKLYSEIKDKAYSMPAVTMMNAVPVQQEAPKAAAHATALDMLKEAENDSEPVAEETVTEEMSDAMAEESVAEEGSNAVVEESVAEEIPEAIEEQQEEAELPEALTEEPVVEDVPEAIVEENAAEEEPEAIVEEVVEEEPVAAPEPESDPNAMMTPDEIAKLIASQSETAEEPKAEEPKEEPVPEPAGDPNAMMSQDAISRLIAAQSEAAEEPKAEEPEEEPAPEPAGDPNAMMSQDDIAALLASMNN